MYFRDTTFLLNVISLYYTLKVIKKIPHMLAIRTLLFSAFELGSKCSICSPPFCRVFVFEQDTVKLWGMPSSWDSNPVALPHCTKEGGVVEYWHQRDSVHRDFLYFAHVYMHGHQILKRSYTVTVLVSKYRQRYELGSFVLLI